MGQLLMWFATASVGGLIGGVTGYFLFEECAAPADYCAKPLFGHCPPEVLHMSQLVFIGVCAAVGFILGKLIEWWYSQRA